VTFFGVFLNDKQHLFQFCVMNYIMWQFLLCPLWPATFMAHDLNATPFVVKCQSKLCQSCYVLLHQQFL